MVIFIIDIFGHKNTASLCDLTPRRGGVWFAVVALDYFTKWVKVEALVNITAKSIEQFLWKNVVCRYGIPHAFVIDNGK